MARFQGMHPSPVYVAEFDDGRVARASFWSKEGKPYDFDLGRRVCAALYARPEGENSFEAFMTCYPPRKVVDGYVEHDVASKPWVRVRDPLFAQPENVVAMVARKNWRTIAELARQALERGDTAAALKLLAA